MYFSAITESATGVLISTHERDSTTSQLTFKASTTIDIDDVSLFSFVLMNDEYLYIVDGISLCFYELDESLIQWNEVECYDEADEPRHIVCLCLSCLF